MDIPDNNKYRNVIITINNKRYNVDAISWKNKTIYEFYGDYWHGNPKVFSSNDINKHNNKSFGNLYLETINREKELKKAGYKLITIWENDFRKQIKN